MKLIVNGELALSKAIGELRKTFKETKYFTVSINTGKKRTLSQNAISHAWYGQVANETKEYTPEGVKRLCKFNVGLSILRSPDPEDPEDESWIDYNQKCEEFIDTLTYEQKLMAMEYFPVTSLMNTKQLNIYLEAVRENYLKRDIILNFPEE